MISLLIEVPVTTDIEQMEGTLQQFVQQIHGAWTWQGREVAGKRLLDIVVARHFDWKSLLPVEERVYEEGEQPIDPAMQAMIDTLGWRLVACWKWDGRTKDRKVYDYTDPENPVDTGEVIRAVTRHYPTPTGNPMTDPLFADIVEHMEDIVEVDENGVEISRTRPTYPKEIHSWGWPART